MQYVEKRKELPKDLVIPPTRTKESLEKESLEKGPPDYTDRACYHGRLVSSGWIFLDGSEGTKIISKPEDLFPIIEKHRHTFVLMPLNQVSILWKGFPSNFQEQITNDPNLWATVGSWGIYRPSPRKFIFRRGNNWHTLWIPDTKTTVAEDPDQNIRKFFQLGNLALEPNPSGVSSIGRDFLFGPGGPGNFNAIREEFFYPKILASNNFTILEDFFSACKRPAMVCGTLGITPPAWNEDMRKAFLQGLIHAPTMSPLNTIVDETPVFSPEASHAVYTIEIVVPPEWKFTPNLLRLEDIMGDYGVFCPTGGPQIQQIGQLRLRQYNNLGIPFKVLRAWKLLPINGPTYPWITRGNFLSMIVDQIKKKESPIIEAGLLYQAALGSLLTHYEYHDKEGGNHNTTLGVFNPILTLYIYEWVFIHNWLQMIKHPEYAQVALRIDATTLLDYIGYKPDGNGLYRTDSPMSRPMFFANPRQKDKDIIGSAAPYLSAVREAANKGEKEVIMKTSVIGTLDMLLEGLIEPQQYGKRVTLKQKLSLGGETRIPKDKKYKEIITPSDLLNDQIELMDPHLD